MTSPSHASTLTPDTGTIPREGLFGQRDNESRKKGSFGAAAGHSDDGAHSSIHVRSAWNARFARLRQSSCGVTVLELRGGSRLAARPAARPAPRAPRGSTLR